MYYFKTFLVQLAEKNIRPHKTTSQDRYAIQVFFEKGIFLAYYLLNKSCLEMEKWPFIS